ncbi:uncharacterized protein TrAtP1_010594 [Trichoderma atroviride]|uniref:Zn(2)-C6 fungal-type domain-containing protein n=1 Tax=Hypocrea atroviridis (strain ATCC 20476 / IMI 206040) TaxID=452589 RepID=G9NHV9_HYPAI|nr:uncharacterized protein TRIATDRAFT_92430 [Trichoderma atroviride IMI 206040]EHK49378.1 hypothetical protein TRIATDRAFT_92430 [Trichoderma atroviride IMI 206040]UKZ69588.1 hypothetical protein TrAtP1_010594 [Trichoderma atroviride]
MSVPLRSKQGCWTCKLRRKKCDEIHPFCSTCESLSIPCYGFGPRPEWMDNGVNERAIMSNLKDIVKHTSRRKVGSQLPKQRDTVVKIAPKLSENDGKDSLSAPGPKLLYADKLPLPSDAPWQELGIGMRQDESMTPASSEHNDPTVRTNLSISADEAALLMHFLDNIFPLQCPLFKPGILEGGRGWLLNLLLQTNPLYYVALAFSTYHRRMMMPAETARPLQAAALVQQEKHLGLCIALMNKSAQRFCGEWKGLGIAVTVIELVFFELFTDNSGAWQTHLRALLGMGLQAHEQHYNGRLRLTESAKQILREDRPVSQNEPTVAEEVACFRFVNGTTTWLDIIYAITTGKAPILLPHLSSILSCDSQFQLSDIMGCQNSVMLQIGRIAAQHEQNILVGREGPLMYAAMNQGAADIVVEIQRCLTEEAFVRLDLSGRNSAGVSSTMHDPRTLITRIFAQMALVYLHLVVHGFRDLELVSGAAISEVMEILQSQISQSLLPALVLPLFIIGASASEGDQPFFRDAFSRPPLLEPMVKHRARILPILEEVWRRKQTLPEFGWSDCLELTPDILLL